MAIVKQNAHQLLILLVVVAEEINQLMPAQITLLKFHCLCVKVLVAVQRESEG